MRSALTAFIALVLFTISTQAGFSTVGHKLFYNGDWVKFKGIGLTCTEYMLKPGMDDPNQGDSYAGHWANHYCFGGPSAAGGPVVLNSEVDNVLKYLTGEFSSAPSVTKVSFESPYNTIIDAGAPKSMPIVRIPMTGSCYLYDVDTDTKNATVYQQVIDKMVSAFTSKGVAVILDLHWNCPDDTHISGCTGAQASMALRNYGSNPGSIHLWDVLSKRYARNPLVLYELYNEPWIQTFGPWYAGDSTNAGMKEMYEAVRKNDPDGLIIIGGRDQYALDAQSGIAFYLQYKIDQGSYPHNILWNIHPYQGAAQGLEHSLRSALRLALALKEVGPVIFTEFGQYCCGSGGTACRGSASCSDEAHSEYFVYNIVNMAEQYDLSWVGWGWRGTNRNNANAPCKDGQAECHQPDMRDSGGVLTDGSLAGANWKEVWDTFVSPSAISVKDVDPGNIAKAAVQSKGFLPRPCIVGAFNLGDICGYDFATNISSLTPQEMTSQSLYDSILPGLPPSGNCKGQGCKGYPCQTYTGPCKQ